MIKLPRTLHLEDSRMPDGEVKDSIKLSTLVDKFVVIEEKIDGTGVGISFDSEANVTIQTRAHHADAKQFTQLHAWADEHIDNIWDMLTDRYVMYGEWVYAKHTAFYDNLCHYFLESDMYDTKTETWLSTHKRQELISKWASKFICSVPIIKIGRIHPEDQLRSYVMKSFFKTDDWKTALHFHCAKYHYDFEKIMQETDDSILSEGLYIKHEDKDKVLGRFKYVRYEFLQTILKSGSHFSKRSVIPNGLTK